MWSAHYQGTLWGTLIGITSAPGRFTECMLAQGAAVMHVKGSYVVMAVPGCMQYRSRTTHGHGGYVGLINIWCTRCRLPTRWVRNRGPGKY